MKTHIATATVLLAAAFLPLTASAQYYAAGYNIQPYFGGYYPAPQYQSAPVQSPGALCNGILGGFVDACGGGSSYGYGYQQQPVNYGYSYQPSYTANYASPAVAYPYQQYQYQQPYQQQYQQPMYNNYNYGGSYPQYGYTSYNSPYVSIRY